MQSYVALAMSTGLENVLPVDSSRLKLCVDSLQSACLNLYNDEKMRANKVLKDLDAKITLSIDVLRCPAAGEYLCLTAHFIAVDWYLRNWIICFKPINTSFDVDDCLFGAVKNCVTDWDIADKVSGVALVNCWVYDEGVDEVKELVQGKRKLNSGGQMFRLYCCADLFELMVRDAFKEISESMRKVDVYMSFGKPSYSWSNAYSKLKEALEFEAKGEWNKDEYEVYDKLTAAECKKVKDICKLLKPLYNAAKSLFLAKQPTSNIYLCNLQEVHSNLAQASAGSDCFISIIAQKMLGRLNKYLKNMFLVLAIATAMDPRCKMKYLEFSFSKEGVNDGNSDLTIVLTTIQSLYDKYSADFHQSRKQKADSVCCYPEGDSSRKGSDDVYDNKPVKSELDMYLEDSVVPWSQDFKILDWWKAESSKYPILSRMARDFLGIPVSVVPSLDAFFTVERKLVRV